MEMNLQQQQQFNKQETQENNPFEIIIKQKETKYKRIKWNTQN